MAGKAKALPKKVVIGVAVGIVALVVSTFVLINAGKTIKLDDYLTVETEGYDGYGTARVTVDWDAIEKKYSTKMSFSGAARSQYGNFLNVMKPIDVVQDCISVEADGTVKVDITYYNTPNNRFTIDSEVDQEWWGTKSWDYYGYNTLDELYKDVVTANMDLYNHEDNVDESAAPETAETEAEESAVMPEDYILADSGTELLTMEDLKGLSAEECKIARNEIYARHGRKFDDEALRAYFESRDWYYGTIDSGDFNESDLSETEIANRDLIVQYEEEKGYR